MRFSLGHLMLVFPAYVLAVVAAIFLIRVSQDRRPLWHPEPNTIRRLEYVIRMYQEKCGETGIDEDVINQYLAGRLAPTHPEMESLERHFESHDHPNYPNLYDDSFGRDLVCVIDAQLPNGEVVDVGVYSTGRDGISNTRGNDPDDFNSWDESSGDLYRREEFIELKTSAAIIGLCLTPFTYIGLLGFISCCKRCMRTITRQDNTDTEQGEESGMLSTTEDTENNGLSSSQHSQTFA